MLENYGKVLEADVLVIGHGIAGLSAAISVKEENPDLKVITVDKAFAGYAGKANKGGGHVAFIPEGEEEKYVEYHSRNLGDYLNDQDMLRKYANSTVKTINGLLVLMNAFYELKELKVYRLRLIPTMMV